MITLAAFSDQPSAISSEQAPAPRIVIRKVDFMIDRFAAEDLSHANAFHHSWKIAKAGRAPQTVLTELRAWMRVYARFAVRGATRQAVKTAELVS